MYYAAKKEDEKTFAEWIGYWLMNSLGHPILFLYLHSFDVGLKCVELIVPLVLVTVFTICMDIFFSGLVPRRVHLLAEKYSLEIPKSDLIPPEKQKTVRMLLKDYHANLQKHLLKVSQILLYSLF